MRAKQPACPARELAPFCVFRTGRQDSGAPEGRETLWEVSDRKGAKFYLWVAPSQEGIYLVRVKVGN